MSYIKTKIKFLPTLTMLIVEMGVSGYFTPIDGFWIFTRVGLVFVFISLVIAEQIKTIKLLPLALIVLSLMSIRDKWQSLEQAKIQGLKSDYSTSVVSPVKPRLENCELLKKSWAVDNCQTRNFKLSTEYNLALEKYNLRIAKSENKKESVTVSLTLYEQQPVWIYIFLTLVMCLLTYKSTPEEEIEIIEEKKEETVTEIIQEKKIISDDDLRPLILNRMHPSRSTKSIADELGVNRARVTKIRTAIEQGLARNKHGRATTEQLPSNVVNFEGKKRA